MGDIIRVKDVRKTYGSIVALQGVSLNIKQGEVFGLLGPNGAGKTTLISILATLVKYESGIVEVNGFDVKKDPHNVRKSIGIVFQESVITKELNGYDNLDFHARLYNIPRSKRKERILEVAKLVSMEKELFRKVSSYSGGMKRRIEIARGLLHTPKILFLDEPTLGLDPTARREVWKYIEYLKKKNVTVLLTTHYMEEAEQLCDRVGIINQGKLAVVGTIKELKKKLPRNSTLDDVFLKYTGVRKDEMV